MIDRGALTRAELAAIKTRSILRMGRRHECFVTGWPSNDIHEHRPRDFYPSPLANDAALPPEGTSACGITGTHIGARMAGNGENTCRRAEALGRSPSPAAFSHALHDPAHQQSDRLGAVRSLHSSGNTNKRQCDHGVQ